MSEQQALFIFKLRRNIALEGDLLLAQMELEALLSGPVSSVADIGSLVQHMPELGEIQGIVALGEHVRQNGIQAYKAHGALSLLPALARRVSFVQQIYCVTAYTVFAWELVNDIHRSLGPIVSAQVHDQRLIIYCLPHYPLLELTDIAAREATGVQDTKHALERMLGALMGQNTDRHAIALARKALSAQVTTAHLSHDVHYYKAKFFPRMVRSLLNICERQVANRPPRIIDNFVGSGTALLEASLLGFSSVGLDIDPLSVLIAETKLEALRLESGVLADEVGVAISRLEALTQGQLGLFNSVVPTQVEIEFPAWLMRNRRMTPEIAAALSEEIDNVRTVVAASQPAVRNLMRVLMSDAISRRVRMRFLGTGVGRFSLTFSKTPLAQIFRRSLEKYVNVVATSEWLQATVNLKLAGSRVLVTDTRRIPDGLGQFDILVTSPPYLPASSGRESYAKARALSLIALDMIDRDTIDELVDNSIGSMDGSRVDGDALTPQQKQVVEWLEQDDLRAIKAKPVARYFLDMRTTFSEMFNILMPGALAVVVSGKQSTFYEFASRKALFTVPVADMLADEACRAGFTLEALHDVQLQKTNKNARPRSLDDYYETLIVLRKP